jgi:hypothetical protein
VRPTANTPTYRLALARRRWEARDVFERRRQPPPGTGLMICPVCRADFVVPVWWDEVEENQLRLLLRCGECDTHHDLVVAGDVADHYEREYVRALEHMAATVERLDRERMRDQASAFATALARDLIDAADFGAR